MRSSRVFRRRFYTRPVEFLDDYRFIWKRRKKIRRAMRELISPAFRERLMMVVTEVNGCRYCSTFHARNALLAGVSEAELRELLACAIPADSPAEELPALNYAQYWAQRDAQPETDAVNQLIEVYGQEKVDAVHLLLHMIRVGNLLGNTFDHLVFRLSFGWLGLRSNESHYSF